MEIKQVNLSNANRPITPGMQIPEFDKYEEQPPVQMPVYPSQQAQPVDNSGYPNPPLNNNQTPIPEKKKSFFTNKLYILQSKFAKLSFQQKFVIFLILLGLLSLISLAGVYTFILNYNVKNPNLDTTFVLIEGQKNTSLIFTDILPLPPEIGNFESPMNGKLLTKAEYESLMKKRPIAVIIDNHTDARPQSGIEEADVVYETLVESGITRLMPVYWSKDPQEVGPIRSVRTYFLDWFSEYDGILYHIGAATYVGNEDEIFPEADAVKYMNDYGIRHSSEGFFRDQQKLDQGIDIEHTAYYSIEQFRDTQLVKSWEGKPEFSSLKFKSDASLNERAVTSEVNIQFTNVNKEDYRIRWLYDRNSNNYKREIAGKKHIEKTSGNQISSKNIVIEQHEYIELKDDKGRIKFTTIGTGKAFIMRDGEVIEGIWEKDSRTLRTKYFDSKGEEVVFNRGKIWVEILPQKEGRLVSKLEIN